MGRKYTQLSLKERGQIEVLLQQGLSLRQIGQTLNRSASTISREVWRNGQKRSRKRGVYDADRAQTRARSRRRLDHRFKLIRQPALLEYVVDRLAMGWSPQQISGWLARDKTGLQISHESIYRYAYDQGMSKKKRGIHRLLPSGRRERRPWRRHKFSALDKIKERVSIHQRPLYVSDRTEPGHWEADLMMFGRHGQALLVLQERMSRYTCLKVLKGKHAEPVTRAIEQNLRPLSPALRRSITFDNGPEFFLHHRLVKHLSMKTYFCDPRAPWQKGGVENQIRRLRRWLPRKTDILAVPHQKIAALQRNINATPRACLDFQTPEQLFSPLRSTVALQT